MKVQTQSGIVEGHARGQHLVFKGIPYAAPPVGPLRFAAPQPPQPWEGVRPANEFGASAIQPGSNLAGMTADGPMSEDCLYLNVFTPAVDDKPRPVMVWIHGGIYLMGSSNSAIYDGGPLCERGDVVVVTINYRLGALGFLSLMSVGGAQLESTANAGQLDQIAALRWVQQNIARFGGDPQSVTVFGESAGAFAASLLMCMPAAEGLFHRAICQSGAVWELGTNETAALRTATFMEHLGIAESDVQALHEISTEKILEAQAAVISRHGVTAFFPICDGLTVPAQPSDAFSAGAGQDIPMIIGSNRDEWNFFAIDALSQRDLPMDDKTLIEVLSKLMGKKLLPHIPRIIEAYRDARASWGAPTGNRYLLNIIHGDRVFRVPSVRVAEVKANHREPAYMYLFTHESPARNGAVGACHALEISFVFGTLDAPLQDRFTGAGPEVEALSEDMMDRWISFAKTGKPNPPGRPTWSSYDAKRRTTMVFGPGGGPQDAPLDGERAAWDDVPFAPPSK